MDKPRIISSDSHVVEQRDLWTSRMPSKFKDRAPHIVSEEDADWWFCDGRKVASLAIGTQVGLRFEAPEKLKQEFRYEEVRLGGYIPGEQVKDNEADGVDVAVIYPSIAFTMYRGVPDSELLTAVFSVYNDWVGEFCGAYPDRLKGIALLNTDDVQVAVKELNRCANLGFIGAMIPTDIHEDRRYYLPDFDPLWAAAQDLEIPLSLHTSTHRPSPKAFEEFFKLGYKDTIYFRDSTASFIANMEHFVRMSLGDIILSGVFERYPKLQVGSVEFELSWAPNFLNRIDYTYTQRNNPGWHRYKEDMLPSDYFHRNAFMSFQQDDYGIRFRDIIGVDKLMWGSDYPHQDSTFPRSQQVLGEILADCTEEEKDMIIRGNVARIYRLN